MRTSFVVAVCMMSTMEAFNYPRFMFLGSRPPNISPAINALVGEFGVRLEITQTHLQAQIRGFGSSLEKDNAEFIKAFVINPLPDVTEIPDVKFNFISSQSIFSVSYDNESQFKTALVNRIDQQLLAAQVCS
jgi:hypothetical protein